MSEFISCNNEISNIRQIRNQYKYKSYHKELINQIKKECKNSNTLSKIKINKIKGKDERFLREHWVFPAQIQSDGTPRQCINLGKLSNQDRIKLGCYPLLQLDEMGIKSLSTMTRDEVNKLIGNKFFKYGFPRNWLLHKQYWTFEYPDNCLNFQLIGDKLIKFLDDYYLQQKCPFNYAKFTTITSIEINLANKFFKKRNINHYQENANDLIDYIKTKNINQNLFKKYQRGIIYLHWGGDTMKQYLHEREIQYIIE